MNNEHGEDDRECDREEDQNQALWIDAQTTQVRFHLQILNAETEWIAMLSIQSRWNHPRDRWWRRRRWMTPTIFLGRRRSVQEVGMRRQTRIENNTISCGRRSRHVGGWTALTVQWRSTKHMHTQYGCQSIHPFKNTLTFDNVPQSICQRTIDHPSDPYWWCTKRWTQSQRSHRQWSLVILDYSLQAQSTVVSNRSWWCTAYIFHIGVRHRENDIGIGENSLKVNSDTCHIYHNHRYCCNNDLRLGGGKERQIRDERARSTSTLTVFANVRSESLFRTGSRCQDARITSQPQRTTVESQNLLIGIDPESIDRSIFQSYIVRPQPRV